MEIPEERVSSWSRLSCIVVTVVTALFCLKVFQATPRFELMFKEMALGDLPSITRIVFLLRLEIVFGVLAAAGLAKEFAVKDPVRRLNLNFVQMAVVLVAQELYAYALFAPMISIMERIGK
ncbi:MAG: hypothetical protein NTW87_16760 [Planctomycetota bacterium]|nr:hypothetical protein [Planctomycetota bacterium]